MLLPHIISFFLLLIFIDKYSAQNLNSISQQKCREYGKNIKTCIHSEGTFVQQGEFPHMALLGFIINNEISYKCSGFLISENYVLTAGQCLSRGNTPVKVKLGELNFKNVIKGTYIQEIPIKQIIPHPLYIKSSQYNDIALLELGHPVIINDYVRPICLPEINENNNKYILTAWNQSSVSDDSYSSNLMKNLDSYEISNKNCSSLLPNLRKLKDGIIESQLCTGHSETFCQPIAGGALQTINKNVNCMYNIHGVASVGTVCPTEKPIVYTKITSFKDWIERIIWA